VSGDFLSRRFGAIPDSLFWRKTKEDFEEHLTKPFEALDLLQPCHRPWSVEIVGGFVNFGRFGRAGFLSWHDGKYKPDVPDSKYCVRFLCGRSGIKTYPSLSPGSVVVVRRRLSWASAERFPVNGEAAKTAGGGQESYDLLFKHLFLDLVSLASQESQNLIKKVGLTARPYSDADTQTWSSYGLHQ
jgi:hypothetical protein